MKTVFLSYSLSETSVSDYFTALSNKLAENYKVVVISDQPAKKNELSDEILVLRWPSQRPVHLKDFFFFLKKLNEFKPVMVISIFGAVNICLLGSTLFQVKCRIAWEHSLSYAFKSTKLLHFRKALIFRLASKLIVNSNSKKRDLIDNFRVSNSNIKVIYNAVKEYPAEFSKLNKNKIIYVGRLNPAKGVDTLLEAMPLILEKNPLVQLTLIGGNNYEVQWYKKVGENLGISNNISFLGFQPKERVLKEFSEAYLAIVPSVYEAFGYVVIESFSVKTPVVGSNTTGIAEIIRDKKDGLLFESSNTKDLATKVNTIMEDLLLRKSLSNNCYSRFKDKFDLGLNIHETARFIENEIIK